MLERYLSHSFSDSKINERMSVVWPDDSIPVTNNINAEPSLSGCDSQNLLVHCEVCRGWIRKVLGKNSAEDPPLNWRGRSQTQQASDDGSQVKGVLRRFSKTSQVKGYVPFPHQHLHCWIRHGARDRAFLHMRYVCVRDDSFPTRSKACQPTASQGQGVCQHLEHQVSLQMASNGVSDLCLSHIGPNKQPPSDLSNQASLHSCKALRERYRERFAVHAEAGELHRFRFTRGSIKDSASSTESIKFQRGHGECPTIPAEELKLPPSWCFLSLDSFIGLIPLSQRNGTPFPLEVPEATAGAIDLENKHGSASHESKLGGIQPLLVCPR